MKTSEFEVARHNDRSYEAPAPWDQWDEYANCWTCSYCGAAAGYQRHNLGCRRPEVDVDVTTCACYGCTIARQRAGISAPDRSAEPCDPSGACAKDGQCWTHSEWLDESRASCAVDTCRREEDQ